MDIYTAIYFQGLKKWPMQEQCTLCLYVHFHTAVTGVGSGPTLATCETSQVLLAGVSGGFPWVLQFCPTYRSTPLYMSEIILKGMLN